MAHAAGRGAHLELALVVHEEGAVLAAVAELDELKVALLEGLVARTLLEQ